MNRFVCYAIAILGCLALAAISPDPASAGRRVALVIGNSAYRNADRLPNTINDSNAMMALFRKAGFDVVDARQDLGMLEFKRAVRQFMITAENADIGVVYFAGHGMEAGGADYLIPVDAKLASDYDADDEAVSLDRIILALQPAQRLRLIILDACRDNPFAKRVQRTLAMRAVVNGLAKIEPASPDTLIAFAAKAGSVSFDGDGPNSPFTAALVHHLAEPGVDIRIALGEVRDEVLKATAGRQEPFVYGSLGGAAIPLVPLPEVKVPSADSADAVRAIRQDYEMAAQIGTREIWESFLIEHKDGFYADLARAQLAKLAASPSPIAVPPAPAKQSPPSVTELRRKGREEEDRLALQRQEDDRRAQTERLKAEQLKAEQLKAEQVKAERAEAERLAALQSQTKANEQQADTCKQDAERLSRLRANPDPDEATRFARELKCGDLRPQVQRLMESLAPMQAPRASLAPVGPLGKPPEPPRIEIAPPPPRVEAKPPDFQSPGTKTESKLSPACQRDTERLNRLRADPEREQVARFARELACEELRPQVQRLLESVGG